MLYELTRNLSDGARAVGQAARAHRNLQRFRLPAASGARGAAAACTRLPCVGRCFCETAKSLVILERHRLSDIRSLKKYF